MAMDFGNWYSDPAQRYNDVIYPQKDRISQEKDWGRRHPPAKAERAEPEKENKLSAAAEKLLEKLKKTYKNVDFSVARSNDCADAKAKLSGGTKQYSVLLTNDELEQMAKDTQYRSVMTGRMRDAFQALQKESEALKPGGIDPASGNVVKSLSVTCSIYGNYSVQKQMADAMQAPQTPVEKYQEKQAPKKDRPERPHAPKADRYRQSGRAQEKRKLGKRESQIRR